MLVRTIFFDLFNTLVSVGEVPVSVGRFTADILGLEHEVWNDACFSEHHDICQPTVHEDVLRVLAHSVDPSISDHLIIQAAQERQSRFDHALHYPRSDVLQALRTLREQEIRLCLISNASTAEVAAWSNSPLAVLFDFAVFSCECGLQKPDPQIYQYALSNMQAEVSSSLYVGDGGSNEFVGANTVGLRTVMTRQFSKQARYEQIREKQGKAIDLEIAHVEEMSSLCGTGP